MTLTVREIDYGSDEYQSGWKLREDVLRLPLGLKFTEEDREAEKSQIHIAALSEGHLVGAAVLATFSDTTLKMQRVAVHEGFRGKGVGTKLVRFTYDTAFSHGYQEILCHAREPAVPFYEKLGFSRVGALFIEHTIPHQKMVKSLSDDEGRMKPPNSHQEDF